MPEYGRATRRHPDVVTKSGCNEFHGGLRPTITAGRPRRPAAATVPVGWHQSCTAAQPHHARRLRRRRRRPDHQGQALVLRRRPSSFTRTATSDSYQHRRRHRLGRRRVQRSRSTGSAAPNPHPRHRASPAQRDAAGVDPVHRQADLPHQPGPQPHRLGLRHAHPSAERGYSAPYHGVAPDPQAGRRRVRRLRHLTTRSRVAHDNSVRRLARSSLRRVQQQAHSSSTSPSAGTTSTTARPVRRLRRQRQRAGLTTPGPAIPQDDPSPQSPGFPHEQFDPAVAPGRPSSAVRGHARRAQPSRYPARWTTYLTRRPGPSSTRRASTAHQGKAVVTDLLQAPGHHVIKAGIEVIVLVRAHKALRRRHALPRAAPRRPPAAASSVRLPPVRLPRGPDQTIAQLVHDSSTAKTTRPAIGGFLQDSWSILDKVTLNVGVRYDAQIIYGADGAVGARRCPNQWSPRVGVIYDFTQQGRSKLFANYARYYEGVPLDIADRSFPGEPQVARRSTTPPTCNPLNPAQTRSGGTCDCDASRVKPSATATGDPNQIWGRTGGDKEPVDPDLTAAVVGRVRGRRRVRDLRRRARRRSRTPTAT